MDFYGILFDIKNGSKMPYSKNYFDTLFAAKLEELGVKTITDTLPIEFTSKGGAIHWTVYGKAPTTDTETGTLPLIFTTHKAGAASDWVIYGNDDGVGERTKNIYNPNAKDVNNGYVPLARLRPDGTINSSTTDDIWVSEFIPVSPDIEYTLCDVVGTTRYGLCFYDVQKNYISGIGYSSDDHSILSFTTPNTTAFLRLTIKADYDTMLVEGNIAPESFIPYGYEISLTISQQGQTDKTVDIYIGDSPLTEGETVSKASTGVDLELFEGENTVSTTLYNKPETSITYTDYIGVGEYVNGQWQIPLTLSHITDNLFDKNAHDTANGFIDNKKVYWDGLKQYSTINDNNYFLSEYMPVTAGKGYYPTDIYYYDALKEYYSIFFYTADKQLIDVAYRSHETVTPAPENATYMRVCVAKNKADSAMMTTKPTSEYIPHKQSTDYTIPIDAPLTEGQSVSDTVEITAYEGENTLDTTLYNKPTMTITYK